MLIIWKKVSWSILQTQQYNDVCMDTYVIDESCRVTVDLVLLVVCNQIGKNVIFYNERMNTTNNPVGESNYAIVELCYIEVNGKYILSKFCFLNMTGKYKMTVQTSSIYIHHYIFSLLFVLFF